MILGSFLFERNFDSGGVEVDNMCIIEKSSQTQSKRTKNMYHFPLLFYREFYFLLLKSNSRLEPLELLQYGQISSS